jgi:acyl-[acyl-carrier-protein]-phospholipid O-acyltransferase/long-chain-fatty-acid--[acyl-carrier-protein] ligase
MGVESAILQATGASEECVAVTSIADESRGERLLVVHCNLNTEPDEIERRLSRSGISKLWIPRAQDFIAVNALPVLANGKLDRRKIQEIATSSAISALPHADKTGFSNDYTHN